MKLGFIVLSYANMTPPPLRFSGQNGCRVLTLRVNSVLEHSVPDNEGRVSSGEGKEAVDLDPRASQCGVDLSEPFNYPRALAEPLDFLLGRACEDPEREGLFALTQKNAEKEGQGANHPVSPYESLRVILITASPLLKL